MDLKDLIVHKDPEKHGGQVFEWQANESTNTGVKP